MKNKPTGKRRKKDQSGNDKDQNEVNAMEKLRETLHTDDNSSLDMKREAKQWIKLCEMHYWINASNSNPSEECNQRIILKFLDYIHSSIGRAQKLDLGMTVLKGRMKRMAELGHIKTEDEAIINVRNPFQYVLFGL